jgi:hypothetical protein
MEEYFSYLKIGLINPEGTTMGSLSREVELCMFGKVSPKCD